MLVQKDATEAKIDGLPELLANLFWASTLVHPLTGTDFERMGRVETS